MRRREEAGGTGLAHRRMTSQGYPMGEMGNGVGKVGRWEEVLLIFVVFPSYCHFLCSWSCVERERKTQARR